MKTVLLCNDVEYPGRFWGQPGGKKTTRFYAVTTRFATRESEPPYPFIESRD